MKRPLSLDSPYGSVTLDVTIPGRARISAESPEGAFWAWGWWQSSERGDEALFARAFWRGQLSQSPYAHAGHAELDALIRSWEVDGDLEGEVESLTALDRATLHAFTRGFQSFQAARRHWPWKRPEFPLSPWTVGDSVLLARTLGLASWWETRGALQRELLGWIQGGVAWDRLAELIPALGQEVDRSAWRGQESPAPWSDAAWSLVHRLHRWRPGVAFSAPHWGATYVCDVTEPGLPFLEVTLDSPGFSCQGLALPGLPVLLAGRSATVAWHIQPSWGDIFDFAPTPEGTVRCSWVGTPLAVESPGSSLGALMAPFSAPTAPALASITRGRGAAALTLTALDHEGGAAHVDLGLRWHREHPRDAWLPSSSRPQRTPADQAPPALLHGPSFPSGPAPLYEVWQHLLTGSLDEQVETLLPELRFLLPETGDARQLKTWSGTPTEGPEAALFQRLLEAVWHAFWKTAGLELLPDHPAAGLLWHRVDALLSAPSSNWLPTRQKNLVLSEAVRAELARPIGEAPEVRRRSALRTLYRERLGAQRRILAATVALTVNWDTGGLHLFHTDDESETPVFREVASPTRTGST